MITIWLKGLPGSGKTYFANNILIPYLGTNAIMVNIKDGNEYVPNPDIIIMFGTSITNIFYEWQGLDRKTAIHMHILDYVHSGIGYPFAVYHPKKRTIHAGELSSIDYLFERAQPA